MKVLEHVRNGIHILRNIYNALKPGGLLIFNDRWWDKVSVIRITLLTACA
jgi:2-polyprenyl-3-methyl-5-hydroxy-6-metoxy-1,4-benzoquinol methylase